MVLLKLEVIQVNKLKIFQTFILVVLLVRNGYWTLGGSEILYLKWNDSTYNPIFFLITETLTIL